MPHLLNDIENIMPHSHLTPDPTLAPTIAQLKTAFEAAKQQLQPFFSSQNLIEKACYDYAQLAIKNNPRIMMLTPESVNFYRLLSQPQKLKEIVFEQEKIRFMKSLPTLAGNQAEKAAASLTLFRLSRLKNGFRAGVFSEYLQQKGLLAPTESPQEIKPRKKVRFA